MYVLNRRKIESFFDVRELHHKHTQNLILAYIDLLSA